MSVQKCLKEVGWLFFKRVEGQRIEKGVGGGGRFYKTAECGAAVVFATNASTNTTINTTGFYNYVGTGTHILQSLEKNTNISTEILTTEY